MWRRGLMRCMKPSAQSGCFSLLQTVCCIHSELALPCIPSRRRRCAASRGGACQQQRRAAGRGRWRSPLAPSACATGARETMCGSSRCALGAGPVGSADLLRVGGHRMSACGRAGARPADTGAKCVWKRQLLTDPPLHPPCLYRPASTCFTPNAAMHGCGGTKSAPCAAHRCRPPPPAEQCSTATQPR